MFINIPISNLSRVYIRVYTTTSSSVSRVRRNRKQGSSSSNFVLSSSLSSLRSFPFRVMHARRSALELKLKCAHDLISIWGGGGGERAIKPECTAHCCAEHCRCAGAKPSNRHDLLSVRHNAISKD